MDIECMCIKSSVATFWGSLDDLLFGLILKLQILNKGSRRVGLQRDYVNFEWVTSFLFIFLYSSIKYYMDQARLGYATVTNNHQNVVILTVITQGLMFMEAFLSCFRDCWERSRFQQLNVSAWKWYMSLLPRFCQLRQVMWLYLNSKEYNFTICLKGEKLDYL